MRKHHERSDFFYGCFASSSSSSSFCIRSISTFALFRIRISFIGKMGYMVRKQTKQRRSLMRRTFSPQDGIWVGLCDTFACGNCTMDVDAKRIRPEDMGCSTHLKNGEKISKANGRIWIWQRVNLSDIWSIWHFFLLLSCGTEWFMVTLYNTHIVSFHFSGRYWDLVSFSV